MHRDIVGQILDDLPPDPTNMEDMIHAALFSGQPGKALGHAARLDPWLAAHLSDFMDALSLLEVEVDEWVYFSRPQPVSMILSKCFCKLSNSYSRWIYSILCRIPTLRLCALAYYCGLPLLVRRHWQRKSWRSHTTRSSTIKEDI